MKKEKVLFAALLAASTFLFFYLSDPRAESGTGSSSQVITGTVEASGKIETAEGKKYNPIGAKAAEVRHYVGEKVQVKGEVSRRGEQTDIKVENYKLMKEPLLEKQ